MTQRETNSDVTIESVGGVGIKRITTVADNSTGKWQGLELRELAKLGEVFA